MSKMKKIISAVLASIMLLGVCPSFTAFAANDAVRNGSMDEGTVGKSPKNWGASINTAKGGEGTFAFADKAGVNGSGCIVADIKNDGTAINVFQLVQELKDVPVSAGKKYTFSFDAKLEGADSYTINRVWLRNLEANERATEEKPVTVSGNTWKTYTVELAGKMDVAGIKVMIQFGNNNVKGAKLYIDNVAIEGLTGSSSSATTPTATQAPAATPVPTAKPANSYAVPVVTECIFKDCTNHWARNEIEVMQKKEVINGKSAALFAPEDNITRAEFLALVTRAVRVEETAFANCYGDVAGKWYANTVQAGFNAGIINQGMIAGGLFEGDKAITREEMTSMISAGYKILTGAEATAADISHFTDNGTVSTWATEDVKKAYGIGIIKGITETTFEPKLNATRAQAAVMIYRLKNYGEKSYKNSFDNDINGYNVTGKGTYTFRHDPTEGASGKGSLLLDISYSGTETNSVQIDTAISRNDDNAIIEKGKRYIVSFAAKLENVNAFPMNVIRCRTVGGGSDHTSRSRLTLSGSGWRTYHIVLDGTDYAANTALVFSAGGCKQSDFKVWLDDISVEEYNLSMVINAVVDDGLESISHIVGARKYAEGEPVNVYAGTKAGENYLFHTWIDKYGNNIEQNSFMDVVAQGIVTMHAKYKPYTINDKGYNLTATSEKPEAEVSVPVVSGDSATVTANVKLPAGYKLADAGAVFYNESYAEAFNIFTEGAKVISAETVSENGAFTAVLTGISETEDVLVKAYAIYKDEAGNAYVHYSDEKILQRRTGEIKPYKIVSNYEMMAGYTPEQVTTYIGSDLDMLTITPCLYRTNMWCSEIDTQWKDYVHGESGEVGGDLEKRVENIMKFLSEGRDLFKEMVTLAQQQEFDVFVNYRMNDHHRTDNPTSQTHNRFYREHLNDLVISGSARVLNYMDPEVRDYYFGLVEELVTNYDVDGLELDFERYPLFFHATEVTVGTGVMTDFVGRVRAMLDRVGAQKGKYLPLSVRVRKSLASSLSVGLDVAEWEKRGYIDMINVTQHYTNTTEIDVESYMAIAETSRVHAELHYLTYQATIDGASKRQFCQPELLRATAANFLERGVDGITYFNLNYAGDFDQIVEGINNVKDPEVLKTQEKMYNVAHNQGTFPAAGKKTYNLIIADDTSSGIFKSGKFRVVYEAAVTNETVEVSINGVKLQETTHESDTSELFPEINNKKGNAYYPAKENCKYFTVPLDAVKKGSNEFTVECTSNAKVKIIATDLALYK